MKVLSGFLSFLSPSRSERSEREDELEELFDPEARLTKEERARRRALIRENRQRFLAEHPNHPTVEHVVDDRVFLLGLDQLYRTRMKRHESAELLVCARAVAAKLHVSAADVPVEGYYAETRKLTEYFRLLRGLQAVDSKLAPRVSSMRDFQRLLSVASAPLYGWPVDRGRLLPVGRDPLAEALVDTSMAADAGRWTLDNLVEHAHRGAIQSDDFSLVGLASIARDRVALAALRESVVLYGERVTLGRKPAHPPIPLFPWRVDAELARRGARFVATFNALFDDDLPEPIPENADLFFEAVDEDDIIGRCVCIGQTPPPRRFYHWAIRRGPDGDLAVEEFWDTRIWTTADYEMRDRS
jgi:hypothetical protein